MDPGLNVKNKTFKTFQNDCMAGNNNIKTLDIRQHRESVLQITVLKHGAYESFQTAMQENITKTELVAQSQDDKTEDSERPD